MNLISNPSLLDQLAASYALGTLRGGARRRFETLARQSATVRAAGLIWQERFASMTELQLIEAPSANVWKRIENVLSAQKQSAIAAPPQEDTSMLEKLRRGLGLWRGAALAGALATVGAVAVGINLSQAVDSRESALAQATQQQSLLAQQNAQLAQRLEAAPQVQYVAVLSDDKSAASVLVTYDPKHNNLTMKRVGGFQEAPDKSLQLWAVHTSGDVKSLGVMPEGGVVKLTAAENQVKDVGVLALSLEPKGGVPPGMPASGPILFKGQLIQAPL
jgi:anti-sigma-K factor RskA